MKVSVVIAVDPTMSRILPKSGIDSATNSKATTTPVLNSILRTLKSELKNETKCYCFLCDMKMNAYNLLFYHGKNMKIFT